MLLQIVEQSGELAVRQVAVEHKKLAQATLGTVLGTEQLPDLLSVKQPHRQSTLTETTGAVGSGKDSQDIAIIQPSPLPGQLTDGGPLPALPGEGLKQHLI